jgi:hypothetical protein
MDKQNYLLSTRAGIIVSFIINCKLLLVSSFYWVHTVLEPSKTNSPSAAILMGCLFLEYVRYHPHPGHLDGSTYSMVTEPRYFLSCGCWANLFEEILFDCTNYFYYSSHAADNYL